MGSSESSERNNGDNNSTTTTDQERKEELKDSAKEAGAVAVAGVAAAVYNECSILASINNKEEDGLMMKAPGQEGVYIKRKDFDDDPASYFKGNRGNILASINNKKEEDGPMMKAPGQNGVYIKRKDFEDDPIGYFKGIRGKVQELLSTNQQLQRRYEDERKKCEELKKQVEAERKAKNEFKRKYESIMSHAPSQPQPQPEASQLQSLLQTTLPPQPPQQSAPRNTRSRANTQSQAPLQPPPQPEASQLQESHSTQQHGTSASGSTSTRRGRGVARGFNTWGTGQKLHIDFNNFMQPYGPNEQQFKTHLGIIARNGEQVPLIYEQWKDVPQDILDYIWKEVEDNTDAPLEYRENCLKNVGDIWRKWKSHVKTHFYDIWDTDEDRLNNIPPRVVRDQWETLVAYWGTEKQQVISAQNKKNRQYQELNHRTGRTPHVQIRAYMEAAGEDTNRINVFTRTRTPKNGGPMNPDTQAVIAEMESRRDAVLEEERTPEFIDGVFTQIVGPDGHGRVRTYGKGVTPQLVFGKGKSTEEDKFNTIREETREETRAEFNAKLDEFVRDRDAEMNQRIQEAMIAMRTSVRDEILAELRGGPSSIGNVPTSSSVHRPDLDGVDSFSHEDINEGE